MRRQSGLGAITAIMVVVILSILLAALVRLGSTQQLNAAHDTLSARAWQAAKAGNDWGLYQALHKSVAVAGSGTAGSFTITTINDFMAAGVVAGMAVTGTGVGAGAVVQAVNSPTEITVSVANLAAGVSGSLTFGSAPAGTWVGTVCPTPPALPTPPTSSQTLDLHLTTGFWVTVTCQVSTYTEGGTAALNYPINIYRIDAVACNSSAGCPDPTGGALLPNYVEREREVIATSY